MLLERCVCVCESVCVYERERERETDGERERECTRNYLCIEKLKENIFPEQLKPIS